MNNESQNNGQNTDFFANSNANLGENNQGLNTVKIEESPAENTVFIEPSVAEANTLQVEQPVSQVEAPIASAATPQVQTPPQQPVAESSMGSSMAVQGTPQVQQPESNVATSQVQTPEISQVQVTNEQPISSVAQSTPEVSSVSSIENTVGQPTPSTESYNTNTVQSGVSSDPGQMNPQVDANNTLDDPTSQTLGSEPPSAGISLSNINASENPAQALNQAINEPGSNSENKEPKKKNKLLLIIIIIVVALLVVVIGGFVFLKVSRTAENFLDKTFNTLSDNVSSLFISGTKVDIDYTTDDIVQDATFTLSDGSDTITLGMDSEVSVKNNYLMTSLSLSNGTDTVSGDIYLDEETYYIDSRDIYTSAIKDDLGQNIFSSLSENSELMKTLSDSSTYSTLISSMIKYFEEALKEADMKTSFKGLTTTYTYTIDDNNKESILNKLKEELENDEELNNIMSSLDSSDYLDSLTIDNMSVEVRVNTLTNEVKEFSITTDEETLTGSKVADNQYKVVEDENNYILYTITNGLIKAEVYQEDYNYEMTLESSDNSLKLTIMDSDSDNLVLNITNTDSSNTFELNFTYDEYVLSGNLTSTVGSDSTSSKGTFTLKDDSSSYTLGIDTTTKYGEGLVTKNIPTNALDFSSINTDLYNILYTQFSNKLENILYTFSSGYDIMDDAKYEVQSTRASYFAVDANSAIDAAKQYFLTNSYSGNNNALPSEENEVACVEISKLVSEGYFSESNYSGVVMVKKTSTSLYLYKIWMTDGSLMVAGKGLNNDETKNTDVLTINVKELDKTQIPSTCTNFNWDGTTSSLL